MQTNVASNAVLLSLSNLAFGDQKLDMPARSAQNAVKILKNRRHQAQLYLVEYHSNCSEQFTELVKAENFEAAYWDVRPLAGDRNLRVY
jgi:hypothetical protein